MEVKQETYDVGVIVGRFQVHELHQAHKDLIQAVCDKHDKVILFLGLSPLRGTTENPLDFESRKQMILKHFPQLNVLYVKDQFSDEVWSKRLDEHISDLTTPSQSVVLYGGRDSFMSHYTGKYATRELVQKVWMSGSELRKQIASRSAKASSDFRAGVVWAAHNRFPTAYTTIDIAIFNEDESAILLGRKANESMYRLIGGFSDPRSDTFEEDARREVLEETGIEVSDPKYIGSFKIDDWRYRGEQDCIKTLLFKVKHIFGRPTAADDIAEVRWFDISELKMSDIMPNHRPLILALKPWSNS